MKNFVKPIAALLLAAAVYAAPAHAQDAVIEAAKAQGIVGEMYTGYLGIADPARANADLQRRIDEINARRLAIYTARAAELEQSVSTIAGLTAEKQIARADAGQAVKAGPDAGWVRK